MMDYIQEYTEGVLLKSGFSDNTILSYKRDLKLFSEYMIMSSIKYENLKKKNAREYIGYLIENSKSPATVHRNVASVKGFYDYLHKIKLIRRNPFYGIELPAQSKHIPEALTISEVDNLLSAPDTKTLKGIRDKAMFELIYATGMKVSELISLKVSDVNLKEKTINCGNSKKTRNVPLGRICYDALNKYLKQRTTKSDMLFVNMYNEPISRQGFWKLLKAYKEIAGISKDISPKVLRHSFAVHLAQNGLEAESLKQLMGYSSIASANVYVEMVNEEIKNKYIKAHPRA